MLALLQYCSSQRNHRVGASLSKARDARRRGRPREALVAVACRRGAPPADRCCNGRDQHFAAAARLAARLGAATCYAAHFEGLPFLFTRENSQAEQRASLVGHAEKKALAMMLGRARMRLRVRVVRRSPAAWGRL